MVPGDARTQQGRHAAEDGADQAALGAVDIPVCLRRRVGHVYGQPVGILDDPDIGAVNLVLPAVVIEVAAGPHLAIG